MKKASGAIIAVLIAAAFPAISYAGNRDHGINFRQHNQQQRMQQGWRSGELTRGEYRHLQGEARDIRREERRYRSDGNLSHRERADLHRDLNRLSRDIRHERHDGQRRFDFRPAARWNPRIDRTQHNQHERIVRGIRSGQLTRAEARQLMAEQRMIAQEERQYRSDGVLTRDERLDLWQDLSAASQHIYNEAHDADRRMRHRD